MLDDYTLRPATVRALRITADNVHAAADWITADLAGGDADNVDVFAPDASAYGTPRIHFKTAHAYPGTAWQTVPVPGALTVTDTPNGRLVTTYDLADFDAQWVPANG